MKNKLANAILIALIGFPVIAAAQESFLKAVYPMNTTLPGRSIRVSVPTTVCTFVSMLQTPLKWKSVSVVR
jgi:hypothetical protein